MSVQHLHYFNTINSKSSIELLMYRFRMYEHNTTQNPKFWYNTVYSYLGHSFSVSFHVLVSNSIAITSDWNKV